MHRQGSKAGNESGSGSGSVYGLSPGVCVSVTNDDDFVVKRCVCANRDNIMRQ